MLESRIPDLRMRRPAPRPAPCPVLAGMPPHACLSEHGRVAEWFKAPVLKTGRGLRSLVGSNPTPSAMLYV